MVKRLKGLILKSIIGWEGYLAMWLAKTISTNHIQSKNVTKIRKNDAKLRRLPMP